MVGIASVAAVALAIVTSPLWCGLLMLAMAAGVG
jgi:hypothetical protein